MKTNTVILVVVIVAVAAALYWFMSSSPASREIVITLSTQNNSGESGTATLTEAAGKTNVKLALEGAPAGVTQPAHVHLGSCATIGGVKYPLTFPVNGVSETVLDVTLDQLLNELPLAINVHKSAAEVAVYVACGDAEVMAE